MRKRRLFILCAILASGLFLFLRFYKPSDESIIAKAEQKIVGTWRAEESVDGEVYASELVFDKDDKFHYSGFLGDFYEFHEKSGSNWEGPEDFNAYWRKAFISALGDKEGIVKIQGEGVYKSDLVDFRGNPTFKITFNRLYVSDTNEEIGEESKLEKAFLEVIYCKGVFFDRLYRGGREWCVEYDKYEPKNVLKKPNRVPAVTTM